MFFQLVNFILIMFEQGSVKESLCLTKNESEIPIEITQNTFENVKFFDYLINLIHFFSQVWYFVHLLGLYYSLYLRI